MGSPLPHRTAGKRKMIIIDHLNATHLGLGVYGLQSKVCRHPAGQSVCQPAGHRTISH